MLASEMKAIQGTDKGIVVPWKLRLWGLFMLIYGMIHSTHLLVTFN